ncbi:MAG: YraN family protein [Ruminococcus sp.]|nr:YraN family protein [Ruminococcus sp.]
MKPMTNQQFGALGEKLAVKYLKQQHYKILEKNYKTKLGEVDIIAVTRDSGREEIAFIEVKTRSADPYLSGMYAVDKRKQFHIMRTASKYLEEKRIHLQPRFDIIEVEVNRASGELVKINHIKNAFRQTEDYARF